MWLASDNHKLLHELLFEDSEEMTRDQGKPRLEPEFSQLMSEFYRQDKELVQKHLGGRSWCKYGGLKRCSISLVISGCAK